MTNLPTDILMQLVRARYTCLVQLRDLGRRQLELIDQGNVSGLLDVLAVKQKPLHDIQRIEKALDPYRGQDPERRQWRSADDRAACARLVEQCDALLAEIVAHENSAKKSWSRSVMPLPRACSNSARPGRPATRMPRPPARVSARSTCPPEGKTPP